MKYFSSFLVFAAAVTVSSMPTTSPGIREIAAIATQTCHAAENNQTELLRVFSDEMMEAIDAVNTTLRLASKWVSVLGASNDCTERTSTIIIPTVEHVRLNDIQNLRLQALLQMSNYANFLKSQHNRTADYADATTQLLDIFRKVKNIVSTLGQLLPNVTCDDIRLYIEEDVSGHVITAPQATSSDKRGFCYCVLELMLRDFQTTLKSVKVKIVGF